MQQNTEEWLEWRLQGIGGSDVPVIMGEYEYSTPYKLWQQKTGLVKPDDWASRGIFAKGHEVEGKIRAAYEFEQDNEFPAAQFENPEHTEVRASLDGWCEKLWKGCEIKFVGKEVFEAKSIKRSHWIQMQYQMLVTKAITWDYVISDDGIRSHTITVQADPIYQAEILNRVLWFWGLVISKTPPPYCDMDWIPVEDEVLAAVLDCIKGVKDSKAKEDKKQLEAWRAEVFEMVKNPRTLCGGAQILVTEKRKSIKFLEEANAVNEG